MKDSRKFIIEQKKGSVTTIYEDPITQTKPEGRARLVKFDSEDDLASIDFIIEYWDVRFEGEDRTHFRKIIVDPKTRKPIPGVSYGEK